MLSHRLDEMEKKEERLHAWECGVTVSQDILTHLISSSLFQTRRVIVVLFCSPHDERRGTASRDRLAKRECACINNKACHVQHPPKKEGKGASHESKKKPITEAHHHVKPTQSLGARHDGTGRDGRKERVRGEEWSVRRERHQARRRRETGASR